MRCRWDEVSSHGGRRAIYDERFGEVIGIWREEGDKEEDEEGGEEEDEEEDEEGEDVDKRPELIVLALSKRLSW
jgi:hypothetical protein